MTTIDIYDISDGLLLSIPIAGAKGYYSLMQHDYITLPFSLQSPVEFGIGSYADLRESFSDALGGKLAKIYKVCDLQTPTYNTATGGYDYTLRLDAYYWLWKNKIFKYTPEAAGQEASWSLTASLDVHLGVFLRNLDALGETYGEKGYEFSIDSTVENKAVAITYDNTNLIDALSRMAEAWDCEWWVTENVIHFGRLENGDAVELETGVNAESMTRNESKGTYATRIYAFGSTRNIPENYRPNNNEDLTVNGVVQKRLMLPADTPYIDARPGLTEQEVVESVVVFDDTYPRRVGTLSDVKTVDRAIEDEDGNQTGTFKAYQYKDTGLAFDESYIIEGEELRIVFQSGKLNGLDFGVTFNPNDADPAEQLWEIVANEDYGRRLPDEVMKPENGDTYILYGFDIKLVSDQYISTAEQELKAKAEEYVAKTQVDDGTYTVPLYSSWVKEDEVNHTFDAGQRIKLKNPAYFGTSGRTSRVIGWEMCLDIPYDRPVYTIGESAQYSRLGELEDKVDALTLNGQAYQGIGGGSGVYLIRTNDSTPASNSNAYSALRARQEFISKTKDDTAKGKITFVKGIDVGTYSQYAGGGTFRVLEDLTTYAEVDKLRVRVKAYFETLEIINTNSVGGKMILTAGGGVYLREVKDRETLEDGTEQVWDFYRCYFLTEQDGREVENRFHVGDLAMSQSFNIKAGTHQGVTNHYYWREVVGIGDDYIDLSKTICDTGSDAPMAEDTVCHLGNRSDKDRQGAIIFSAVDVFSPSITLYYGINDFSLVNKDYVSYGVDKSTGNAFFRVYGEMYAGDREQTSYVKYTPGVGVEMRGKFLNQAGESYDTIIDSIQNAIDGNIETWFGEEEPTLQNYPASEWTTDEDKNTHLGDLYYSDAGVAYRFQMEGAQYVWKMLKDSDITKALADAKAAKDAADAAQEAADAAADRLTAWASDGVISPTEKQGIKDEIARIDADKANITAQYTKYGLGTPTAFNNAYTAYRSVLVSLSASTPENIAIPSDFSSKQTYYYNERTSALGAIADASISSVNDVSEQLEQMKQDFAEVKEDVAGVKTSVDGLKNFTDEAFADGIVDRNESAAIASHINSIETFAKDAAESYTKVYENALLTGTAKTNLANAYTAFTTAKTELVTTINGAIADGLVDALEKSAVDGKYTAFNTKYGDFVANLNAANRAIQDAINQNALQALQKIGELDYLKAALKEFTTIEGGLIQSSTLALGYTSDSGYQVMAGTNGIYDASKLGGGIASWWGGAMFDRFEYTEETMPENVASALVRMDGTGYFAKGNLWWESDGTLHADPLSFFVGEDSVGDVLGLFQFVKSDAGVEYVIPQHPFQKLEIGNYLQIGKAQLYWDEANQAFYVRHQDGVSPVGFYATGFISTKGANPNAGGAVSGASKLTELEDVSVSSVANGQVLTWDVSSQKWVNKTVEAGLDTAELEEYLTSHNYAKKSDIPALTDYATQEWVNTKLGSYATTSAMNSALGNKVDKVAGKGLSSNDFTDALLTKLNGIEEGANKYVLPTATGSVLGGVKVGATLAIASGVLNMKAVGTAGTYTKVTVDAYGRVTGHASLAATDIPNLPWSKITSGKPTTLAGYGITDAYTKTEADGRYVNVSGDTMTGTLHIKPTTGSYTEGIRLYGTKKDGSWSNINFGCDPSATSGTHTNQWILGRNSSNHFVLDRGNSTGASGFVVTTAGNMGIGTTSPSYKLHVVGGIYSSEYIQIGSGRIKWDSSNNALYVEKSDGTAIGFYSKGFISVKGANDDAGGSVSGITALSQLSDVTLGTLANGQALVWDSTLQKWVNKTIESGLDETALAQYLTDNGYATQGWATSQFAYKTGTNASGTWPISISGSAAQLGGLTWSNFRIKRIYSISLSSLPTTNFYPIFFGPAYRELDCEINSPNLGGEADYNNNRIHFLISSAGWSDNGYSFVILSRSNYSDSEITIGAIGCGQRNGGVAVWVRGGMSYTVIANQTPSLKTSNYTNGEEIYTVGTNIYGGTNTYVSLAWQNTTSTYRHSTVVTNNSNPYFSSSIKIGSGTIYWDATNNCFHFSHGLYSDSFVSAKGANSGSGGTVSGVTKLSELSDVQLGTLATNQVLSWNGSKWVNKTLDMGLDETALAQYLTNNQYLTMPTGDGRYALKGGSNATGTWPISITGNAATATKLALQDTRSVNTAPFTGGEGLRYHFKQNTADGLNDGGTYHSVLQFNQWSEQSGGLCKQLALTDGGNMWFRTASSATAWGAWKKLLDSSNYASTLDTRYVKKTGDTMTGTLTTCTTGTNLYNQGIRINRTALNQWATLTIGYVGTATAGTSANTWLIGTPSSSNSLVFNLNSASESAGLCLKGHGNTDMKWNNQTVWHAGNDGSGSGLDADLLDGYNASSFESYRLVTINASSLNQNTWYPVTMVIGNSLRTRIRIEGNTSANASWNTRADKFMALYLDYSTNGSMWGWTGVTRYVNAYVEGAGTSSCLRGLGQLTNTSTEYVYVRGGAVYNFYVSRFITPVLRTSTYTVQDQSVSPTTTMPAAISRNVAFTTDTVYAAQRLATAWTNALPHGQRDGQREHERLFQRQHERECQLCYVGGECLHPRRHVQGGSVHSPVIVQRDKPFRDNRRDNQEYYRPLCELCGKRGECGHGGRVALDILCKVVRWFNFNRPYWNKYIFNKHTGLFE